MTLGHAVAISMTFHAPSAVSMIGMKRIEPRSIPDAASSSPTARSTSVTSRAVSHFGMRIVSGRCGTITSRSSRPNGVESELIRTTTSAEA